MNNIIDSLDGYLPDEDKKQLRELIERIGAEKVKDAAENAIRDASNRKNASFTEYLFRRFYHERIREPCTIEEKLMFRHEPIKTSRIKTIFSAWKKDKKVEISTSYIIERLAKIFGEPINGTDWVSFKVFATDENVEEWDSRLG
jgi:hypothetical protein